MADMSMSMANAASPIASSTAMNPSTMSMSAMSAVFSSSISTPLYSNAWTPSSRAQYAGTCIFLLVLGVVLRAIQSFRVVRESKWRTLEKGRRYAIIDIANPTCSIGDKSSLASDSSRRTTSDSERDTAQDVSKGGWKKDKGVRPWRLTQDLPRAALDVIIAGIGYLLMLAVMTGNVGYFLSVLGGIFVGSVFFGRFEAAGKE